MKIFGFFIALLSCVILSKGQWILETNCGTFREGPQDRIMYGETGNILEHPWMAFISTKKSCDTDPYQTCLSQCGGTLVTDSFVLTAAHCDLSLHRTTVSLGRFDTKKPSANTIQTGLAEIIIHPYYDKTDKPKHDIALLRLNRTVRFSDFIKPICLTNYQNLLDFDSPLVVSGWGVTEYGVVSRKLRRTRLGLYDRKTCSKQFGPLISSQICAGGEYSDTCLGDSGGPITGFYNLTGRFRIFQVGVVSFGDRGCRGIGIYTNVMQYSEWIADNIIRRELQTTPAPTRWPVTYRPTVMPAPKITKRGPIRNTNQGLHWNNQNRNRY